jgi:hypothetical protein
MKPSTSHFDLDALAAKLPIVPLALFLSCLFSLVVILQNPLLNDDAYKYLRAAEIFSTDGALAVLESFGWYNYSLMIALADRVLPGGAIVAAHTLNTALYALLTYTFLLLVRELRDTPRTRMFAAVCILVLPLTNEMRYFLIRDIGFAALALLSLVWLIRHNRTGDTRMAFYWSITLVAACVFRLEGLMLFALAPWSLLLPDASTPMKERAERCGRLVGILAAVVVSVLLVALLAGYSLPELIGYAYRWYIPLLADLSTLLNGTAANVGSALFPPNDFPGSGSTGLALVITLFGYGLALLMNVAEALSYVLVLLLLAPLVLQIPSTPHPQARRALQAYIGIAALELLLFILIMHFTTQRYATLLVLLLLTQAPLVLDELYARARTSGKLLRSFHACFFLFTIYFVGDSLISFGHSQQHVEAGIAWTRTQLPAGAQLKTNNFAIAYHSGHVVDYDQTQRDTASVIAASSPGDYLALEFDRDDDTSAVDTSPAFEALQNFSNERTDELRIYLRH